MHPVEIEVLLLRALAPPGPGVAYRVVRAPLAHGTTPDGAALRLAGIEGPAAGGSAEAGGRAVAGHPPGPTVAGACVPGGAGSVPVAGPATVCHSTSWRHEAGTVVLTYAALPDPRPGLPAATLDAPAVLCSEDPLRPAPAGLHGHHVVAHAVRHLAYLAAHDPVVARAAAADRTGVWRAVLHGAAGMPVGTHVELLAGGHLHPGRGGAAMPAAGVPGGEAAS
ncbi:hypothetical protein [Pseudonocardia sp.]|uniref:hypothetical protein n=1 Tax=Pseudonocardia sp. TaxID=60912 RepID=UPI003D12611D